MKNSFLDLREVIFNDKNTKFMTLLVHLTPEKNVKSILKNGIKPSRNGKVYAMPVIRNFYASHQWLRELKSEGPKTICGISFRIPDKQLVSVGYFNQPHEEMTADAAASLLMNLDDPLGYEVLIPRSITRQEIHKVRYLPQLIGWRYYPRAHGRRFCLCSYCQRGRIKSRRVREAAKKKKK